MLRNYFIFKGQEFVVPPIRWFHTDKVEVIDGITYHYISRRVPLGVQLAIYMLLLITMILGFYVFNTYYNCNNDVDYKLATPKEVYYYPDLNLLDIDITNSGSNYYPINVQVQSQDGVVLCDFKGIRPGHSIGSVPITGDINGTCDGKVIYYLPYVGYQEYPVLIVDRSLNNKDINTEF